MFYPDNGCFILHSGTPSWNQEKLGAFKQGNDPKHTSRIAKAFLKENVLQIIDWSSNSPDLNPIENSGLLSKQTLKNVCPKIGAFYDRRMEFVSQRHSNWFGRLYEEKVWVSE